MDKRDIILAAMSPSKGGAYTPVQAQKLLFLIDRNLADQIDGPIFIFEPYNYGPFDKAVYEELENLETENLVEIIPFRTWTNYKLTDSGQEQGEKILATLPINAQNFISALSEFVCSLSFSQLVTAIYKAYPGMQENSVFRR